jgi:hypothetical protein
VEHPVETLYALNKYLGAHRTLAIHQRRDAA